MSKQTTQSDSRPRTVGFRSSRQRGQTLIVALIILGLLMLIGFVYIGIINRNIQTAGRLQSRSVANDLSYAGITYAHTQLLNSADGADWRGRPAGPIPSAANFTRDPDALYLRPASQFAFRTGTSQPDLGGPDGLGPFIRVNFNNGRALVRVRYAPSDINVFSPTPTGALRSPGLVRNYLILESVGRPGRVDPTDPTTVTDRNPVQYQAFGPEADYRDAMARMQANERNFAGRAINRAFASIGIIETARFVTNKYKVSRPVEIGISEMMGAMYDNESVATGGGTVAPLALELGAFLPLYTISQNPAITPQSYPGFGSLHVNGDLLVHGNVVANVNKALGDKWTVAGNINAATSTSQLRFQTADWVAGSWTTNNVTVAGAALDSQGGFNTNGGLLVDGRAATDPNGYPRGVGNKIPPSMLAKDPDTGETRYIRITRDSGVQLGAANSGVFGHGTGVYVNNTSDRQMPENEMDRQAVGSEVSLVYDWLNPNNAQPGSGWRGFLYTPPAAYVQLLTDGFSIIRNGAAPPEQRTWRYPDGSDSNASSVRYRIGFGTDGRQHIVNTFTAGTPWNINANLGAIDYQRGPLFNGVLFFEGNVRVRGTIATDVQLTLVSNASIYIEGSITKGVLGNGMQPGIPIGDRIPRLSRSMLMLMARDYVTLNTTQFFGASPTQSVEPVSDLPSTPGFTPIRVRTGDTVTFQSDFILDPAAAGANPLDPRTWPPYAATYSEFGIPANRIKSGIMISHTMDDGPAPATFIGLNINQGPFDTTTPPQSTYYFPQTATNLANAAPSGFANHVPIYGMGGEPYQRYGKFESLLIPLVDPATVNNSDRRLMVTTDNSGRFSMFSEGINDFRFRQTNFGSLSTNDYLIGKAAILPHDIRIEATIFAEEGSFFVIPGQWFNPNPNDRRDTYASLGTTEAERAQRRLENFGSYPEMPFYGEPPDVRITVVGAISENMPPSIDQQSEWVRKWGWIPRDLGASGARIPAQHVPNGYDLNSQFWVPNLTVVYDSVLATARANGFNNDPNANPVIRQDEFGRSLPPLPKLPVGPALAFFGEVH